MTKNTDQNYHTRHDNGRPWLTDDGPAPVPAIHLLTAAILGTSIAFTCVALLLNNI